MNGIELSETTQKLSELPPPEGEGFGVFWSLKFTRLSGKKFLLRWMGDDTCGYRTSSLLCRRWLKALWGRSGGIDRTSPSIIVEVKSDSPSGHRRRLRITPSMEGSICPSLRTINRPQFISPVNGGDFLGPIDKMF